MHGLGNDYIYLYENDLPDNLRNDKSLSELAIKYSDRHFGIGADGIILIKDTKDYDFFMQIYNADGSKGEMCGNGIRCVGKYVYERGLTKKTHLEIDTLAGVKYLDLKLVNNKVESVVDKEYQVMDISMGNPHTVIFVLDITDELVLKEGPKIENNSYYPNRTNVEFAKVVDTGIVQMRVWERGSGETMACGTGACAVATAYMLKNPEIKEVTVKLRGGDLKIKWQANNHILMEGPATKVFDGEI